eukprot:GHRQ01001860.1.p1 GENE.GHRQ01001860.1~~GHRQ01001860.1.p1  ORF type:complete len:265 (+),score=80.30 GHRQ01001860.1:175-969(+)
MQSLQHSLGRDLSTQHTGKVSPGPARCFRRRHVCQASAQQQQWAGAVSRRQLLECSSALAAAVALNVVQPSPAYAGIDRYVKRKKLDPLETYVPLVLEARERLATLDTVFVTAPTVARQLMRSGPFSGLRDNIRALGQYASTPVADGGSGLPEKEAQQLVSGFFRALEDFDLVLYNAVREAKAAQDKADKENKKRSESADEDGEVSDMVVVDPAVGLDKEAAAAKLVVAVEQLDKLIATVPGGVLARSREVLDKVNKKTAAAAS